ncbi:hypothetical protein PHJA_002293600 [Phtheirospermum japonicum]|uniref:Pectinesterase inhibitor domain-containing protein n=1 Tax=Phtheirospermum japonicum TaxID=374723 RepID=A0A830CQA7_9LAMI|nr:hypothetical protein PHJA_002293600 [Phtheirospermum japonicum]
MYPNPRIPAQNRIRKEFIRSVACNHAIRDFKRDKHGGAYIKNLLSKAGPNKKGALQDCKKSYDDIISAFNSALSEVRDDKEYLTATYGLLIGSTDTFQPCLDDVAAGKIKDGTILNGNDVALIYAFSAYQAVDSIPEQVTVTG